ncbi:MAG: SIS domain-containing protein [Alphaproteobacteria bacterium]
MTSIVPDYFAALSRLPLEAEASNVQGQAIETGDFVDGVIALLRQAGENGNKLMIVGNGGSAAIASHLTVDFSKNVGIPALAFNDAIMMSALGNDMGQDQVFARPIAMYGKPDDVVLAISSSGNSDNIVEAVWSARNVGCKVVTMSGFRSDNRLRRLGDWNLYVPNGEYGFVEITHLAFCHAIVDLAMGWSPEAGLWTKQDSVRGAA